MYRIFFFHSQRLGLFELFLAFKCPIDIDQMCLAEKAGAFNCPVDIDWKRRRPPFPDDRLVCLTAAYTFFQMCCFHDWQIPVATDDNSRMSLSQENVYNFAVVKS